MGFFDKVKGFLNVGGVSLKITKVENPFKAGDTWMSGKFMLTTDSDRTVLSYTARFYKKITKKENNEEKTETACAGADVILKPNICNAYHGPEYASTTNPQVLAALVSLCLGAGAKRVRVLDYPFAGAAQAAYATSGIEAAVEAVR